MFGRGAGRASQRSLVPQIVASDRGISARLIYWEMMGHLEEEVISGIMRGAWVDDVRWIIHLHIYII